MAEAAISDLGVAPETALLFNVSLVVVGVLNMAGGALLYGGRGHRVLLAVFIAAGIGAVGAGLFPLSTGGPDSLFALLAFLALAGARGLMFVVLIVIGDGGDTAAFGVIGHGGTERMIVYANALDAGLRRLPHGRRRAPGRLTACGLGRAREGRRGVDGPFAGLARVGTVMPCRLAIAVYAACRSGAIPPGGPGRSDASPARWARYGRAAVLRLLPRSWPSPAADAKNPGDPDRRPGRTAGEKAEMRHGRHRGYGGILAGAILILLGTVFLLTCATSRRGRRSPAC